MKQDYHINIFIAPRMAATSRIYSGFRGVFGVWRDRFGGCMRWKVAKGMRG